MVDNIGKTVGLHHKHRKKQTQNKSTNNVSLIIRYQHSGLGLTRVPNTQNAGFCHRDQFVIPVRKFANQQQTPSQTKQ